MNINIKTLFIEHLIVASFVILITIQYEHYGQNKN